MDDSTKLHSSHHPPGAVSYNVTLHQHQAPPGAHDGKSGDHDIKGLGGKQIYQSEERNNSHWNETSSKFPYKVYEMSEREEKSQNRPQKQSESTFTFSEFNRLDTLLNLSVIHRKRALDVSRYLIDIGKATIQTGLNMVQIHSVSETQSQRDRNAVKIGRRLISAGEKILVRGEKVFKAVTPSKGRKPFTVHKLQVRVPDVQVVSPVIKMISLCSHGPSHYGVTLLGGIHAGHFVGHGKVDNMRACIKKCCANHQCDLAFMVREDCYSVICYHKNLCRSVRAQHVRKYQPRIAHIWRGSSEEEKSTTVNAESRPSSHKQRIPNDKITSVEHREESVTSHVKSRPTAQKQQKYQEESVTGSDKTILTNTESRKDTKLTEKNKMRAIYQQEQNLPNKHLLTAANGSQFPSSVSFTDGKLHLSKDVSQKHTKTRSHDAKEPSVDLSGKDVEYQPHSPTYQERKSSVHKHPGLTDSHSLCPHSSVEHNVGLRRGLKTGNFTYIGELFDIKTCLEVCCRDPDCDIAFMLGQSCYTVHCASELVCRSIPYHQHKYSTEAVFVTRRFNKHASELAGLHNFQNNSSGTVEDASKEKPIQQSSLTTTASTHINGSTTLSAVYSRKAMSQNSIAIATVTYGNGNLGSKHPSKQPMSIHDTQSKIEEMSANSSSDTEEVDHYKGSPGIQNSSELWKHQNLHIDFNDEEKLTSKAKESGFLEIKINGSGNEEMKHETIEVYLNNAHNLKNTPSSNEEIKINLAAGHNATQSGKESDVLTRGMTRGEEEPQKEMFKAHLPSSVHEKPNLTTTRNHLDIHVKVSKSMAVSPASAFRNGLSLDYKEIENHSLENEKEGGGGKRTAFGKTGSVDMKVDLSGKNSQLHGEPDYYKPLSEESTPSGENSGSVQEEEENIGSESGMFGSTTLQIKVHLSDRSSLSHGEPVYYKQVPSAPSSEENSQTFRQIDEQSGSSESGMASSTTFGSGIDYDTGQALALSYPESNEAAKNVTTQSSTKVKNGSFKPENCTTSDTYYNVTLRGGFKAGNFTFVGIVSSEEDCVTRCCASKGCDVTFMVLDRCFLVDCSSDDLCDAVPARNVDTFMPIITYVNLTIINELQAKSNRSRIILSKETDTPESSHLNMNQTNGEQARDSKNGTVYGHRPSEHQSGMAHLDQSACIFSKTFHNVSFRLGRQAGVFTNQGLSDGIRECAQWCCESGLCDVAFMISQDCFFVRCHSNKTCRTFPFHGSKFNPRMVFVEKHRVQLEEKPGYLAQDGLASLSIPQWNMSTQSSTASYPVTESSNYNERMSSSTVLSSPMPSMNDAFPPDINPTRVPFIKEETSTANFTTERNPEPEAPRNLLEGDSSDFVEVKTNGSEFWWQYFNPEEKHSTNSNFKAGSPEASNDGNSTITTGEEASPRNINPSKASILNVKTSLDKINSDSDTELELKEHVLDDSPSDYVEVKTNFKPEHKQLENSSFNTVEDSNNSVIIQGFSPQTEDKIHAYNSNFKRTFADASSLYSNLTNSFHTGNSVKLVEKDYSQEQNRKEKEICSHAEVVNGVTLRGGYYAGVFTRQDNATSINECVAACCSLSKCNLAFMVAKICYAVQCFSKEKCTSVKAHFAYKYHPLVAYIRPFQEQSLEGFNVHLPNTGVLSNSLRCVLDDISEPKYKVQDGSFTVHSAARDLGDCAKFCCQTEGCEVALEENGTCYSLNCHGNRKCPHQYLSNYSRSLAVLKDLIEPENTSERIATDACDFSQVLHEVVLRGGSHSGKFKYLMEVQDMETCIKECCRHKVCDVALMLKDNCFLVSCHNEMLCDAVPSRSSEYHPQLAYKIKHGKRRNIGEEL